LCLGTVKENAEDCFKKGRNVRGVNHPLAKLSEAQVREIRTALDGGEFTQAFLAQQYGVDPALIGRIFHRRSWSHVK
jgi:hypothetical protein